MKQIKESKNKERWPRIKAESVECRKQDLVIRITNWMKDEDEHAYDVECYIGGVYDWNQSKSFTMFQYKDADLCKLMVQKFVSDQINKLL